MPLFFQACDKESEFSNSALQKIQAGQEFVLVNESDFPSDLTAEVDGNISIGIQSNRSEIEFYNGSPEYNFNASLLTSESAPEISMTTGSNNNNFTLTSAGAVSGYKVYNTASTMTNPTYLSNYFSKNVDFSVHSQISTSPVVISLYVPAPVMIDSPSGYPDDSWIGIVNARSTLTWNIDPQNKNALIVRLINNISSNSSSIYTFITPDDGELSFTEFSHLLEPGMFSIEIGRINYKNVTHSGKSYRVVASSTSVSNYIFEE